MTSPPTESKTLDDLLEGDLDTMVDYESDTNLMGHYESKPSTPVCEAEDDSRHATNPFP